MCKMFEFLVLSRTFLTAFCQRICNLMNMLVLISLWNLNRKKRLIKSMISSHTGKYIVLRYIQTTKYSEGGVWNTFGTLCQSVGINLINVYLWKKMNYSILAHTCILNLLKQCWGAPNSIYFQATLEPTILPLHNCYEIWAFIFSRTTWKQYSTISTEIICWGYFGFFITNTNLWKLNGKTYISK